MKLKFLAVTGCVVAILAGATLNQVQDPAQDPRMEPPAGMPEMPEPSTQHDWLKQLEGEWVTEGEIMMVPGQAPMTSTGTESVRLVGGFWAISEYKTEFQGEPFTGILTLGYNVEKGKYIGTWIDSMTDYLWTYEGEVDESGKKLTLRSEAPNPEEPGKMLKFRESIEFRSPDHKVFTSSVLGDQGEWFPIMTIHYHRKKP